MSRHAASAGGGGSSGAPLSALQAPSSLLPASPSTGYSRQLSSACTAAHAMRATSSLPDEAAAGEPGRREQGAASACEGLAGTLLDGTRVVSAHGGSPRARDTSSGRSDMHDSSTQQVQGPGGAHAPQSAADADYLWGPGRHAGASADDMEGSGSEDSSSKASEAHLSTAQYGASGLQSEDVLASLRARRRSAPPSRGPFRETPSEYKDSAKKARKQAERLSSWGSAQQAPPRGSFHKADEAWRRPAADSKQAGTEGGGFVPLGTSFPKKYTPAPHAELLEASFPSYSGKFSNVRAACRHQCAHVTISIEAVASPSEF